MAANPLQKACILTILACLLVTPAQSDEANPENEPEGQSGGASEPWPPCTIVYVGLEAPYVDPHPECITIPTYP